MIDTSAFKATLNSYRERTEAAISRFTPAPATRPAILHEAMRYSLEAGGKRLRPCLLLAAYALNPREDIDPMAAAVAVESLHTYSLIHDDLPCMDDSDLRRGRPTCHKQFDEVTALLAGDALLTHALWLLAEAYHEHPVIATGLVRDLGHASGSQGMIGGQMEDLLSERGEPTAEQLDYIHRHKTGALMTASLTMGVRLTGADEAEVQVMREAGTHLGLAFQIIDDILDVTSDAETMGKPVGADEGNEKMTYPSLYGLDASRAKAAEHTARAIELFGSLKGDSSFLIELARYMETRVN